MREKRLTVEAAHEQSLPLLAVARKGEEKDAVQPSYWAPEQCCVHPRRPEGPSCPWLIRYLQARPRQDGAIVRQVFVSVTSQFWPLASSDEQESLVREHHPSSIRGFSAFHGGAA